MKNLNSPETPFCKKPWKPMAAALALLAVATFAWGFHLLQDHAADTRVGSGVGSAFSRLQAVGVGAVGGLDTLNRGAVVNVATLETTGGTQTIGSGFLVNPNGYVVTALHTVQGRQTLLVRAQTLTGQRSYEAEIVKIVPTHDLALLKIVSRDLFPFLAMGDSQKLAVGERLYTVGDPQGAELLVRETAINSLTTQLTIGPTVYANLIRTDALSTWGETGGPVINTAGRVVGVQLVVPVVAQRRGAVDEDVGQVGDGADQ
ncbi:MAG: trypsin-like peptidase domain-containing protein, partial [Nitrospinae bacterium]|nr:trypsin-like peptidase domain-containing protein [Nitrospinota bacterium]